MPQLILLPDQVYQLVVGFQCRYQDYDVVYNHLENVSCRHKL